MDSFRRFLGDWQEKPWKLYVYKKFLHQEIRWKERFVFYAVFIYQYTFIFVVVIYTVSWRYKKDYFRASLDILLLQNPPFLMFGVVLATSFQGIVSKHLQSDWLRGRQYLSYFYKKIWHYCTAVLMGFKMTDLQSPPENQLSHINTFDWMEGGFKEILFWFWDRNSLYWHQNIQIKLPI